MQITWGACDTLTAVALSDGTTIGGGIDVRPARRLEDGTVVRGAPERHHVVLAGLAADMIQRQKFTRGMGSAGGYMSCWFCAMQAVLEKVGNSTFMRWFGYSKVRQHVTSERQATERCLSELESHPSSPSATPPPQPVTYVRGLVAAAQAAFDRLSPAEQKKKLPLVQFGKNHDECRLTCSDQQHRSGK